MNSRKIDTLFQGTIANYNSNKQKELREKLLFFIKENGLTISQAKDLFTNVINSLEYYGTLLTIADYEKITSRNTKTGESIVTDDAQSSIDESNEIAKQLKNISEALYHFISHGICTH